MTKPKYEKYLVRNPVRQYEDGDVRKKVNNYSARVRPAKRMADKPATRMAHKRSGE